MCIFSSPRVFIPPPPPPPEDAPQKTELVIKDAQPVREKRNKKPELRTGDLSRSLSIPEPRGPIL